MDLVRQAPSNFNAEKSVLGAMMLSKDAAYKAMGELTAEDFSAERHRLIFLAMKTLSTVQKPIDFVTLTDELERAGNLEDCGGYGYITDISTYVPSAAHIGEYIGIVKRNSQLRQISVLCGDVNAEAGDNDADPEALLAMLGGKLADMTRQTQGDGSLWTVDDIAGKGATALVDVADPGIVTGYPTFDRMTGGLPRGAMVVLAARPGVGKSALALNICRNILNRDGTAVIFSLEMSNKDTLARLLTSDNRGLTLERVLRKQARTDADTKLLCDALWKSAARWPGYFCVDNAYCTPDFIRSTLGSVSQRRKIDLVVVDYLQLMGLPGSRGSINERVTELSRRMKLIAMEYDVPVLVLSQMNRMIEGREVKRPMLSDLRDSGSIEQDADMVIFLSRQGMYDTAHPDVDAELVVAKNRQGECGVVRLTWDGPRTLFTEQDRTQRPEPPQKRPYD